MEQAIAYLFLAFFSLEFFVEFALNELNMRHVRRRWVEQSVPEVLRDQVSAEDLGRSVAYTLAKARFQRWGEIYDRGVILLVLFGGVLPFLDQVSRAGESQLFSTPLVSGILFCLGVGLLFSVLGLPADLYSTFGIESRFGFNKTTVGLYLIDKLKGLVVGLAIGVPFLFGVLWLMEATGRHWWLWAFVFIFAFQFLMLMLYPTLIAPLFNKFEPLKEGELRERILALADQVGFKASGIYTMDGSKRSTHSNAYFTGVGKSKRIILFDTLIDQMNTEEGLAVLAHEMGHYKMKHIRKMLLIQGVGLFVGLYILSLLVDYEPMFRAFGLEEPTNHGALVLFSLLAGPFLFYLGPLMNRLSRKHEFEADRFAVKALRDGKPMEEALIRLTVGNLSNLNPHPWYSAYHYSHPTPAERVGAIRHEFSLA